MIVVDLSKQQVLDTDPKAIQQSRKQIYIEQEMQESISFLKKRKKLSYVLILITGMHECYRKCPQIPVWRRLDQKVKGE